MIGRRVRVYFSITNSGEAERSWSMTRTPLVALVE
jgi:hypothetical protein